METTIMGSIGFRVSGFKVEVSWIFAKRTCFPQKPGVLMAPYPEEPHDWHPSGSYIL